jgi:hypothetical protein
VWPINDVVGRLVDVECRADRQYVRLERKLDALDEAREDWEDPPEEEPFESRMIEQQMRARWNGLLAVRLRRFGEHQMASLLVNDPVEYRRLTARW